MQPNTKFNHIIIYSSALIAILLGLISIVEGGSILFGDEIAQKEAGNFVPFVLWFNFSAAFIYIITGFGLLLKKRWAVPLSLLIFLATLFVFALFIIHIILGYPFEMRTVIAMTARSTIWGGIFLLIRPRLSGRN